MAAEERLSRMDAIRVAKACSGSMLFASQAPLIVAYLVNMLFNRLKMLCAIRMEKHRLERFTLPLTISSSRRTRMTRVKRGYVKPSNYARRSWYHYALEPTSQCYTTPGYTVNCELQVPYPLVTMCTRLPQGLQGLTPLLVRTRIFEVLTFSFNKEVDAFNVFETVRELTVAGMHSPQISYR